MNERDKCFYQGDEEINKIGDCGEPAEWEQNKADSGKTDCLDSSALNLNSRQNTKEEKVIVLTLPLMNQLKAAIFRHDKQEITRLYYELWPEEKPKEEASPKTLKQ